MNKIAWESFIEWKKYMTEMYEEKKTEVQSGETREGMDLMGRLRFRTFENHSLTCTCRCSCQRRRHHPRNAQLFRPREGTHSTTNQAASHRW